MQGLVPFCKSAVSQLQVMLLTMCMAAGTWTAQAQEVPVSQFMALVYNNPEKQQRAFNEIRANWQLSYAPMLLEISMVTEDQTLRKRILELLREHTGQNFIYSTNAWLEWVWSMELEPHSEYEHFKASLYGLIDQRFTGYFDKDRATTIRLDEVLWGGVQQDGIPPLRNPKMINASEADYLSNHHVVFGIEVNGDVRAYPKRIMAWHELFTDVVGDEPLAGVYCTLCGTMILYKTNTENAEYTLGTSGFLYRSNKLMYDKATQSLWNTIWGRPVIGPLVGQGIKLEMLPIVTTTWGEWKKRHPNTKVLSLETGFDRDYGEGVAYHDYFATHQLMFTTPRQDKRLLNKQEVLALLLDEYPEEPLAIASYFLSRNKLHHDTIGERELVVVTDRSGASRVYESAGVRFKKWDKANTLKDDNGQTWTLTEQALVAESGWQLARIPAHRSFWFGWYAAHPSTRLVK